MTVHEGVDMSVTVSPSVKYCLAKGNCHWGWGRGQPARLILCLCSCLVLLSPAIDGGSSSVTTWKDNTFPKHILLECVTALYTHCYNMQCLDTADKIAIKEKTEGLETYLKDKNE